MKRSIWVVTILIHSILAKAQVTEIENFIKKELQSYPNCEIAIGMINEEEVLKLGYKITNGSLMPTNNSSTLFEIASISKIFTASLLARELFNGTISLNDPLAEHLRFKIKQDTFNDQVLKMKHLVTHTSGLKKNPIMSYKRYANYLQGFKLDYVPGNNWEYNNLTVGLLGIIIADKNETTWSDLLKQKILRPLEMETTYTNRDETPRNNRVQCVDKKGEIKDCYFHNYGEFVWPAGGMISNVDDMMRWLKANMESEDYNLEFLNESHDPLDDEVSMGWFSKYKATQGILWWHYRTGDGDRVICHGGNSPEQTSFLAFNKKKRKGVIILTNVDGRSLVNEDQTMKTTELAMKILER